ncbi:hypothetical protein PR048_002972 [Dryococelus australis]|uniref:Uncharacterized protein n=1 Tax=Dryococelus australis TaxID=614101 RepID=A0ABQ9INZ4_9NEOP|nr:hypothetical protein PR048_002972 [Dryococelus australis]
MMTICPPSTLHPGRDGVSRVIAVRTKIDSLKWPVVKLCPCPFPSQLVPAEGDHLMKMTLDGNQVGRKDRLQVPTGCQQDSTARLLAAWLYLVSVRLMISTGAERLWNLGTVERCYTPDSPRDLLLEPSA